MWMWIDTDSDIEMLIECGKPLDDLEEIASAFTEELGLPSIEEMNLTLNQRVYV